ncbi:MAG: hypothetical protein U5S82_09125 [Gammaproteobacteria bacterium]|nr:hypothetical protein [Gammaproteobacteria bacterium]
MLGFEDIKIPEGKLRATLPPTHGGLQWSNGWYVEPYAEFLAEVNSFFKARPAADGAANLFYLTNLERFDTVHSEVEVKGAKTPFLLHGLELYSFPDDGEPIDIPEIFSSALTVTIDGFDAAGRPVNRPIIIDLFPSGKAPFSTIQVSLNKNSGWTRPVHSVVFTAEGGSAPRFVMDNLAFTPVPLPPALLLLGSAATLLLAATRRRRRPLSPQGN